MTHDYLYPGVILIIIILFFGMFITVKGFRGIWRRRPVYNINRGLTFGNYLTNFLLGGIITSIYGFQILEINEQVLSVKNAIIVLFFSVLLGFLLGVVIPYLTRSKSTAGVSILGINRKILDLLRQALTKEKIAFAETHEDFDLTDQNSLISTSIWSGVGYAAIRISPRENSPLLEKLILDMKEYDRDHSDHYSIVCMVLETLLGLAMMSIGITLIYFIIKTILH